MAVPNGADVILQAENAPGSGVFVNVAAITRFNKKSDTDENTHMTFGAVRLVAPGIRNQEFSISGFLDTTDAGQAALRTAESTRVAIKIRVLFDGTNGYEQSVRVRSFTHEASAEGDLQPITFDFAGNAASTIIGTGPNW